MIKNKQFDLPRVIRQIYSIYPTKTNHYANIGAFVLVVFFYLDYRTICFFPF